MYFKIFKFSNLKKIKPFICKKILFLFVKVVERLEEKKLIKERKNVDAY